MKTFDLTPDPKVLLALTHTPMQPLDALCELIDNSIDSFQAAFLQGHKIKSPIVIIDLPRQSDVISNLGRVVVRDNGPGLTLDQAEKALRAGFSGNNPYDSLGLFGMGFNISTGKIGTTTSFITAIKDDEKAIEVVVNLEKVRDSKSYEVPVNHINKPDNMVSGTLIEISQWWPEGNPNSGFVKKLVQYGMPKVREEIGRRYSTIIKNKGIQIVINGESCPPYEHCIWDDSRSLERKGLGRVPAVFRFDELIGSQKRCTVCTSLVSNGLNSCQACGSLNFRTIEERIRGWIGIQRFDDTTNFGIDLIRNGRAIRIGEKSAFFEFTDEFKKTIKDYPIDGTYGRIVGEVHLNHVPVDFLKQDFQRSSPEWIRCMTFLRGDSSLQPTQVNADKNKSPVYKLYQGYRRVRNYGQADMYMGNWDSDTNAPKRISRSIEKEYYDKFLQKIPGYFDDREWWKLVEEADKRPLEELVECPECSAQNLKGHDSCNSCGCVLIGKNCIEIECGKLIPQSAVSCPHCGNSQIPEIIEPWLCEVCEKINSVDISSCSVCASLKGTLNPISFAKLISISNKSDELSLPSFFVNLADGSNSTPLDVNVYITNESIVPRPDSKNIPVYAIKSIDKMDIFIDSNHVVFKNYRIKPENFIASELALFLYDSNRRLTGKQNLAIHTLSNLTWNILRTRWGSSMEESYEKLFEDIDLFFKNIKEKLPSILKERFLDIYEDLDEYQQKSMVENILSSGTDIRNLTQLRDSGKFLSFIDNKTFVEIFKREIEFFFDGSFWTEPWNSLGELSGSIIADVQNRTRSLYVNCFDDLINFSKNSHPEPILTQRARCSLILLEQKIV